MNLLVKNDLKNVIILNLSRNFSVKRAKNEVTGK